jgi:type III restriction enzyme
MNVLLKPFQLDGVDRLVRELRLAAKESRSGSFQVITLSSPTGSGKTLMATAAIETLIRGDDDHPPNQTATFLWISDQPELNEQTRRKMISSSTELNRSQLVVVDSAFDYEVFKSNVVYFLNIQKLGKDKQLISSGDDRNFTIWETIDNTIRAKPGSFFIFIDEAHRGMAESSKARSEAATIIQKFIKGSPGELQPAPIIVGISATPERFDKLLAGRGTERTRRRVAIDTEDVRGSGLLKDVITLYHPRSDQQSDFTMLRAAARAWKKYCSEWREYCENQNERTVEPIMAVQVQDRSDGQISKTNLDEAIRVIREEVGLIGSINFAHAFQEGNKLPIKDHELRYLAPADIEADSDVQVVFFKTSLNTGWDCPRAEVMMSFRTAVDAVVIAQLVGRMVRTPLARRVDDDEHLNSVALYLPHYNENELKRVIERLTEPDPEIMPPVQVEMGDDVITLNKAPYSDPAFAELEKIPSYVVPRPRKITEVRRLKKLSRLLAHDALVLDGPEQADELLLKAMKRAYNKVKKSSQFKKIVEQKGKIFVNAISWRFSTDLDDESEVIELDIAAEDLDDHFESAGRKLGEGLHKAWWKDRVARDDSAIIKAKRELVAMSLDPNLLRAIEHTAKLQVRKWLHVYNAAINKLPEARQQEYSEIRRMATDPEEVTLTYPTSIEVTKRGESWGKHLYIHDSLFYAKFNAWEKAVLETELAKEEVIGWIRNPERKDWSLRVPYRAADGKYHPCYPDFLFVRSMHNGLIVDILDPHLTDFEDASVKAIGLAEFADKHWHKFGRIELIIVERGEIKRLDLCEEKVREKVLTIKSNEQLKQLFRGLF